MNDPNLDTTRTSRSVSKKALVLLVVGLVIGGTFWKTGVLGMFSASSSQLSSVDVSIPKDVPLTSGGTSELIETAEPSSSASTDQILGAWTFSDGDASRVIENRDDGTATIDVTFGFLASFLYGSALQLDLEWTLEDDVLTHTIVGGSPETGKEALIRDYGETTKYKILKLTDEEMHLMEFGDEADDYLWKRSIEE